MYPVMARVSKQATPVDSIKDVVQSSMQVPEFNKHLKKARGHNCQKIVEITIKMKTIIPKPLMRRKSHSELSLEVYCQKPFCSKSIEIGFII